MAIPRQGREERYITNTREKKQQRREKPSLGAACSDLYLSTTLAGLILSMTMTCLFRCVVVVSVIPSVDPGVFAISTSKGPEAFATVSAKQEKHLKTLLIQPF